ncbi:hypothetical protein [Arenimonas caeni]|jgi:hypothetical protein|uniref:Uncharacterized protein n=1 Tax=Arenimonas caeni TaxID=2058085 RepID=A0A2P6MBM5_9GAMM|nr:hypothetical protein [Arenimonas caeni]PRH83387.1 hypothetical protein C6N40_01685 [Arenimonas caeni]
MYKFVTVSGSCGSAYDIGHCERTTNDMQSKGFELVQVYQTSTAGCCGPNSTLVMVFRHGGG